MDQCPVLVKMLRLGQILFSKFPDSLFHRIERVDLAGQDTELHESMKGFGHDSGGTGNVPKLAPGEKFAAPTYG